MAPAVEYSRLQPRNSWPTPTTTKYRREDAREVGHGAAAELDVDLRDLRSAGALGACERRGRSDRASPRGTAGAAGVLQRPRLGAVVDAAHDEVHDGGEHERGDEGAEARSSGSPATSAARTRRRRCRGRRSASFWPNGACLKYSRKRLPLRRTPRCRRRGRRSRRRATPPQPTYLRTALAARLQEVARLGDTVASAPGAAPSSTLKTTMTKNSAKADDADHLTCQQDARPEHGAEADLAEPQPVHVVAEQTAAGDEHAPRRPRR